MRNFLIITCLLLGISTSITAQDSTSSKVLRHSVGLVAGSTTGLGFGYKYTSPIKLGIQTNYLPIKTKSQFTQTLGLTFSYDLISTEKSKFYVYQSNSYWRSKNYGYESRYYDYATDSYHDYSYPDSIDSFWNQGIGFGMEFISAERIGINFMTGYGVYDNWELFSMTGEFAVFFKF